MKENKQLEGKERDHLIVKGKKDVGVSQWRQDRKENRISPALAAWRMTSDHLMPAEKKKF